MDCGDRWSARTPAPFLTKVELEYTLNQVERLLTEAKDKHKDHIIDEPPVTPVGGDVYLYKAKPRNDAEKSDFKYDQYRWISKGSNNHSNRRKKSNVLKKYFYIKDPNGRGKDSLTGFKRHVFSLLDPQGDSSKDLYLIHYIGDSTLAKNVPHGNSKSNTRVFIPTKRSVNTDVLDKADFRKTPHQLYKHLHESSRGCTASIPVACPRDAKQVENILTKARSENRLCNDELFSLYELALHTNVIKRITLWPNLLVYVGHDCSIELARELIKLNKKDKSLPQLLSYDTTFNLGDFYVSPLVMRNVLMEGDPIFPVMFLIHERKFEKDHDDFLTEALQLIQGECFPNIPIVTDREKGIMGPLQVKFKGLTNILCRNHLLKDIEMWCKKKGGGKDDIKVLKDHVEQLLDCATIEDFRQSYEELQKSWTQGFHDYVENTLKDDMINHACRFVTSVYPAFSGGITATNNISESFNRVLKEEASWKEWPIDTMVLMLYYMQIFYAYEFQRAERGLGNWHLKEKFKEKTNIIQLTDIPKFRSLKDIVATIKEDYVISKGIEKGATHRMTQKAMAKMCVENGHIGFSAQTSTFTVLNVDGKGAQAVRLFPQPSTCSCRSTGLCYHILAVNMAVGIVSTEDKMMYSLSTMKRRKRGPETKSGRKKARTHDYDYTVNPAPDSILVLEADGADGTTVTSSPFRLSRHLKKMDQSPIQVNITPPMYEAGESFQADSPKSQSKHMPERDRHPWEKDIAPVLFQLQHCLNTAPEYIKNALMTLNPGKWLCSDAIDESIQGMLTSSSSHDVCLLCPTYIYQSVAMESYDIAFTYLKRNDALNKDLLIIPLNLDPRGKGTHWCLGIANFRSKQIWIFDSLSSEGNEGSLFIFSNLLWIVEASHEIARTSFHSSHWRCIFSTDTPKQPNGFDCGVYTILNAYSLITKTPYTGICSNTVRDWLKVIILTAHDNKRLLPECPKPRPRRKQIWTTSKISPQTLAFEEEPLQAVLLQTMNDLNLSKNWSQCASSTCSGDFPSSAVQILCCKCRLWFHTKCVGLNKIAMFSKYHYCVKCKA